MSTESNDRPSSSEPATPKRRSKTEIPKETRDQIVGLKKLGYGKRKISKCLLWPTKDVALVLREEGLLSGLAPPAQSKLEPFRGEIVQRVQKGLRTSRILREIRELGYRGGRTILAQTVSQLRITLCLNPVQPVKRRFETDPGKEMQIDFSPYRILIGGVLVLVHAFAALLCYSRRLYLRFFREERTSTVLEGLAGAFEYHQGVTCQVVIDNMVQAVLGRVGPDREVLWQPRLLDCARHYGFEPVACAVRDPDRKGKDEKIFQLIENDFLKGSSFESWDDLERRSRAWLDRTPEAGNSRVHGTTRKIPNEAWEKEERPFLIRLPDQRFATHEPDIRDVDRDSTLSIRGTRYTVPASLAGRSVAVRLFAHHFEVLDQQQRVAFSRQYVPDAQKGKLVIDSSHYALLPRRPRDQSSGRLDETFVKRFSGLAPLVDGIKRGYKTLAPIQIRALLRLADRHGQDAFLAAATRAQEYHRFDAGAVKRILEQEHPLTAENDDQAPLGGAGPAVLGEVDAPSLESYGRIDAAAPSPEAGDTTANPDTKKPGEGGNHGA